MEIHGFINIGVVDDGLFLLHEIIKQIQQVEFILCTKHYIHTFDLSNFFRLQLCVTTHNSHKSIGVSSQSLSDSLSAGRIGIQSHGTGIYNIHIGFIIKLFELKSFVLKISSHGRGFREI